MDGASTANYDRNGRFLGRFSVYMLYVQRWCALASHLKCYLRNYLQREAVVLRDERPFGRSPPPVCPQRDREFLDRVDGFVVWDRESRAGVAVHPQGVRPGHAQRQEFRA